MRTTYTYVRMEVSKQSYDEVAEKLNDAHYDHAFTEKGDLDMNGIAICLSKDRPSFFKRHENGIRILVAILLIGTESYAYDEHSQLVKVQHLVETMSAQPYTECVGWVECGSNKPSLKPTGCLGTVKKCYPEGR